MIHVGEESPLWCQNQSFISPAISGAHPTTRPSHVVARQGGLQPLGHDRLESCVADLREELEQLGSFGLWRETTRRCLSDHWFVQSEKESFAETMARTLGISMDELRFVSHEAELVQRCGRGSGSPQTLPIMRINGLHNRILIELARFAPCINLWANLDAHTHKCGVRGNFTWR